MSPALPKKERRYKKKRSKDNLEEVPPEIPVKGKQERPGAFTAILLLVCCYCCCFYVFLFLMCLHACCPITCEPHLDENGE